MGLGGVNVEEESEVNDHSQGEQQRLHRHARPDEHNHSQHGQQAAVQVVLGVWRYRQALCVYDMLFVMFSTCNEALNIQEMIMNQ